jgi:hypothetical protein
MHKPLIGAGVLALFMTSAASAQVYYDPAPRQPYATGVQVELGVGPPDCSFTLADAHAGVTVLGVRVGGGARVALPRGCRPDEVLMDRAPGRLPTVDGAPVGAIPPYGEHRYAYQAGAEFYGRPTGYPPY